MEIVCLHFIWCLGAFVGSMGSAIARQRRNPNTNRFRLQSQRSGSEATFWLKFNRKFTNIQKKKIMDKKAICMYIRIFFYFCFDQSFSINKSKSSIIVIAYNVLLLGDWSSKPILMDAFLYSAPLRAPNQNRKPRFIARGCLFVR